MIRYANFKNIRARRLKTMKFKSLSMLLVLLCSCVLLTGCFGSTAVPKGWSGPVSHNGSLYIGTMDGYLVNYKLINVGTSDEVAKQQWRINPDSEARATYFYGSPAITGDYVYIGGYAGKIYAVKEVYVPGDNSYYPVKRWEFPASSDELIGNIVGDPAVSDGILYIGSSDEKLYAINATTGEQAWQKPFATGDKIWSTPVVYNGTVYVGSFDKKLYAIDAQTGNPRWSEPFETGGAIVSTPTIYNDVLYFGSLDQKLYAVDAATGKLKDGFTPFKADDWFWAQAVAYNGSIIAASLSGTIYALDAESGAKQWQAEAGGSIRGTPSIVNNRIVVGTDEGSDKGRVYCYDADTGQELWQYPSAGVDPMYAIHASIGSNGDVVYVHTTNQKIYAFNVEQLGTEARYLWTMSTGGGE